MKKSSKRGPYEQALAEMRRKKSPDLAKVNKLLCQAMREGEPKAAYALGTWYLHGRYYKEDWKKAVRLLKQAADAKVPEALYDLAICYEKGAGVRKKCERAFELYLTAGLCGDRQAVFEVGRCLWHGIGVTRDKRIARIWYRHAASLGITD